MVNATLVGKPIKITLPLFTFPVVDRVRVAFDDSETQIVWMTLKGGE